VLPWFHNPLVPGRVKAFEAAHLHGSNFIEQSLFLGYTVLALAVVAVVAAVRARRGFPVLMPLVVGAAAMVFSMPPSERLAGIEIHFPSDLLVNLLPVFRVYSRFGMAVGLAAALLAGWGLHAVAGRLPARAPVKAGLLLVPFLTLAAEFTDVPPSRATAVLPAPAEYTWLHDQPNGILVEYPLAVGTAPVQEVQTRQYSMYQMVHEHPMFNGAAPSSPAGTYATQLEPFYAPGSVSRLRGLGIRYVFVHRADYAAAGQETPRSVPGLEYVTTFGDTDVFLVGGGP
jgi:hypothetical protein